MDDVDPGGVADMAGISKGDFLLAINDQDVTQASHERVVTLIRQSGDLVNLTVVTVTPELNTASNTVNTAKQFSTLPRKMPGVSGVRSPLQHPPPPPKRDPTTTLSVGRARAKSMLANLAAIDALDKSLSEKNKVNNVSDDSNNKTNGATVAQELELIFKRESGLTTAVSTSDNNKIKTSSSANSSPAMTKKKVYNSVAQMKRSKHQQDSSVIHKDYHSTPDLQSVQEKVEEQHDNDVSQELDQFNRNAPRKIHSQEDLHLLLKESASQVNLHPAGYFTLPHKRSSSAARSGPAPSHPPPPPPPPAPISSTQSRTLTKSNSSDYAKVSPQKEQGPPASSFNPSSSARLYESPKDVANIAYSHNVPSNSVNKNKKSPTRTNSLPSRPRPMVLKRIEVKWIFIFCSSFIQN